MAFTARQKLRARLQDKSKIVVAPGVYDGFSARTALEIGFDCLYMTGAGTSASLLGQADLGLCSMEQMAGNAGMISRLDPEIPVIADADTGYGGPVMVARTIAAYHQQGVSALHIEDQVQTKRCGHLGGKEVVSREIFGRRILAAVQARETLGSDILIIARTDALQTDGFEEAVSRLQHVASLGADIVFLEGITSRDEACRFTKLMGDTPCLLNMVEHGVTPSITPDEAHELGFRIIIFPFLTIGAAYYAMRDNLLGFKKTGKTGLRSEFTPKRLFTIVGLEKSTEVDKKAGGDTYDNA